MLSSIVDEELGLLAYRQHRARTLVLKKGFAPDRQLHAEFRDGQHDFGCRRQRHAR